LIDFTAIVQQAAQPDSISIFQVDTSQLTQSTQRHKGRKGRKGNFTDLLKFWIELQGTLCALCFLAAFALHRAG